MNRQCKDPAKDFTLTYAAMEPEMGAEYTAPDGHGLVVREAWGPGTGTAEAPFPLRIALENTGGKAFRGVIRIGLAVEKREPRFFLPGFLYGRNRGDTPATDCKFPMLRSGGSDCPVSSYFQVRGDRLSHPCSFLLDRGKLVGFHTAPYFELADGGKRQSVKPGRFYQYGGFFCDLDHSEKEAAIGFTVGYENAPWLFIQSHNIRGRRPEEGLFTICPGETVEISLFIFDYPAEQPLDLNPALEAVYWFYHMAPRRGPDVSTAIRDIAEAVSRDAWLEQARAYSGFVREGADGSFLYEPLPSVAWTNGLPVALPLLMASDRLSDPEMRRRALCCIETMVNEAINPRTSLPYDAIFEGKRSVRGWWYEKMGTGGHAAYLCGQFAFYLLLAWQHERLSRGVARRDWLACVQNMLAVFDRTRGAAGEYPRVFSEENGAGLAYSSMGSSWCLAAAALYTHLTGDTRYLAHLTASTKHYHEAYLLNMECYGGPLDAVSAVDNEGILAYIRALRYLHAVTGEARWLAYLRDALNYEFSFKFCYNVPNLPPPLGRIGWSSCGGSITSVANPHIHPMSSTIIAELQYYAAQTGDPYVRSRLRDTIRWSRQTYNRFDREYDYGKKGWMSERFCYSQGLLVQRYPDGSPAGTWFALMPWAACSVLEGLLAVKEDEEEPAPENKR